MPNCKARNYSVELKRKDAKLCEGCEAILKDYEFGNPAVGSDKGVSPAEKVRLVQWRTEVFSSLREFLSEAA